jgi:hypothetical protein
MQMRESGSVTTMSTSVITPSACTSKQARHRCFGMLQQCSRCLAWLGAVGARILRFYGRVWLKLTSTPS